MIRKKYGYYEFELTEQDLNRFGYIIFLTGDEILRESDEYFSSKNEASLAAIGHITLLEKGEG